MLSSDTLAGILALEASWVCKNYDISKGEYLQEYENCRSHTNFKDIMRKGRLLTGEERRANDYHSIILTGRVVRGKYGERDGHD